MLARRKDGFSIIELMIVLTLLGAVGIKAAFVISEASEATRRDSTALILEDRARLVLDRIAYSIMGADKEALVPELTPLPFYSNDVEYRVSLGVENGVVIWSDKERIGLEGGNQVVWIEKEAEPGERKVVWTNLVRSLLEGEEINGEDDNGNGMVDEEGLTFIIDENRVTIRLSLARQGEEGSPETRTVSTTVTCRNRRGT